MSQQISAYSKMLSLDNDIRISASSSFSAQQAYEATFEDTVSDITQESKNKNLQNPINIKALGAPIGFWSEDGKTSNTIADIFLKFK